LPEHFGIRDILQKDGIVIMAYTYFLYIPRGAFEGREVLGLAET
jgi:hypothetical protein